MKKLLILLDFLLSLLFSSSYFSSYLHRGLRSKKIKRIEHNLAINIKETQKKIWNGVQKDVGYIRKILNEVYFLKFKVSHIFKEDFIQIFSLLMVLKDFQNITKKFFVYFYYKHATHCLLMGFLG